MTGKITNPRFMLKNIFNSFINLIFPIQCLGCSRENHWLCLDCLAKIKINSKPFCPICHKPANDWRFCPSCQKKYSLDGVFIASSYQNKLLQRLIHSYKYRYVKDLSQIFFRLLKKFFNHYQLDNNFLITSLPLHLKRLRLRCFNQAEELANHLADFYHIDYDPDLLKRIKNTKPQARLDKEQRSKNIKNAFALQRGCYGRKVIIVDDVFTTGSTLNECARILKKAGAKEVWGLVIAKG